MTDENTRSELADIQPDQNKTPVPELVERLKSMAYVSGVARCAKCGFQLIKSNLNVSAGTVTADEDPPKDHPSPIDHRYLRSTKNPIYFIYS